MRLVTFAKRNAREILRDPLNLCFGLGFPLVLILLLSAIQANVPVSLFEIAQLAPGIVVFGLAFMTLFSATLISRDRGSALLQRLYTTPLKSADFILGYTLPIIPIAVAQSLISYAVAVLLGLEISINIVYRGILIKNSSSISINIYSICIVANKVTSNGTYKIIIVNSATKSTINSFSII